MRQLKSGSTANARTDLAAGPVEVRQRDAPALSLGTDCGQSAPSQRRTWRSPSTSATASPVVRARASNLLSGELVPGAIVSPSSSHSSTTFPVRRWVNAVVESPRRSDWRPAPHRASKAWRIAACLEEAAACSWLLQEDPPVAGGVVAQLFDRADEPLYALGDERAVKGLAWDLPPLAGSALR